MYYAQNAMADFKLIYKDEQTFTPEDSVQLHEAHRDWLKQQLAQTHDGKTVVITHHFPSPQSIHAKYAEDSLTPAFGSDLEVLLGEAYAALWIHGHTHEAFDYEIKGTRVICNPRGYTGYEKGEFFRPDLVVEI